MFKAVLYITDTSFSCTIYPMAESDSSARISITKRIQFLDKRAWAPAEVNWQACGDQKAEYAQQYAIGILESARVADWLDIVLNKQMYTANIADNFKLAFVSNLNVEKVDINS